MKDLTAILTNRLADAAAEHGDDRSWWIGPAGDAGLARQGAYLGTPDGDVFYVVGGEVQAYITGPLALAIASDLNEVGARTSPAVLAVEAEHVVLATGDRLARSPAEPPPVPKAEEPIAAPDTAEVPPAPAPIPDPSFVANEALPSDVAPV